MEELEFISLDKAIEVTGKKKEEILKWVDTGLVDTKKNKKNDIELYNKYRLLRQLPQYISIKEAALLTGKSENTIRNWNKEGKIEFVTFDGTHRVDKTQALRQTTQTIAVFNDKGGEGKTTISLLLADWFSAKGYKVLLVDGDQSAHLTSSCLDYEERFKQITSENLIEDRNKVKSLFHYFNNKTLLQNITYKLTDNIDIIPATDTMKDIKDKDSKEIVMHDIPKFDSHFSNYEIVIYDCPPNLSIFPKLGLELADFVIFPVTPTAFGLNGLSNALNFARFYAERCVDIKVLINYRAGVARIRADHEGALQKILGDYLLKNKLYEKATIQERQSEKGKNLFIDYKSEGIEKIIYLFEEIEDLIYRKRSTKDGK